MKALSQLGDICSVLGFLLTLGILMKLQGIHRSFLAQARLPDLKKKIRGHRAALSKLLNVNDFSASGNDIEAEIQKCDANLRNLQPKLGRPQAANVTALIALTTSLTESSSPLEKERVREIYLALVRLEEDLGNLSEDMKWRARE
jgi:hypothetical protein